MSNYNLQLQSNNIDLQTVLQTLQTKTAGGENSNIEDALVNRAILTYTNDRITSIGSNAFHNCTTLLSVSFPECTKISGYAFAYCYNLTSISFPVCAEIGDYAFRNCSKLTSVNFPVCSYIGSSAFL
jgi:hypothetical protein